jgi:hypothetical protein
MTLAQKAHRVMYVLEQMTVVHRVEISIRKMLRSQVTEPGL